MECHLYLFRHAQSYDNINSVFSGWRDSKLSKAGKDNAKVIALRLKDKRIDVAFYTRLSRSKDTLKEVLRYHPECLKLIQDDRMIERNYGKLQGKTHLSIVEKKGAKQYDLWHRSYKEAPPGGESIEMVEKRVKSFIKELLKFIKKYKVNVAISCHGNSMRPFRRHFEGLNIKEMIKLENPYDDYFEYKVKV